MKTLSIPTVSAVRQFPVCAAQKRPDPIDKRAVSRRDTLRRLVLLPGVVGSISLAKKAALADAGDELVKEIEKEIPEVEEKLSGANEAERSAVEEELEVVEKEVAETEEKLAKGEETPEEAKEEAGYFQAQLDALKSILGF